MCFSVLQCVAACCTVLQCVGWQNLQCTFSARAWAASSFLCCSVLQCVAVCCSMLQCVTVCCIAKFCSVFLGTYLGSFLFFACRCEEKRVYWHHSNHGQSLCCSMLQCVAVCCRVLQGVAVCCSVLQCDAVCRSVQSVAECCRVLQSVAACCRVLQCQKRVSWHHSHNSKRLC